MKKYLTRNIIGLASGIEYGKKGDKVTVINDESDLILVEGTKERFHVRQEALSDDFIPADRQYPLKDDTRKKKRK